MPTIKDPETARRDVLSASRAAGRFQSLLGPLIASGAHVREAAAELLRTQPDAVIDYLAASPHVARALGHARSLIGE